jgi:hypothetical protein
MSVVPLRAANPAVTIRVSGQLFQGHLTYLDQVVRSAVECGLRAVVDLQQVVELDRAALLYLMRGEGHEFAMDGCPDFIQQRMRHERQTAAA